MSTSVIVHHVVDASADLPPDAPAVILSNSLGSTLTMWDQQVAALARHFRVVRYDTRGHGESSVPDGPYTIDDLADDVIELLDRLDLARAHFVGLSLGGMTGLRLAARNPDRVDRLAVLSTSALLGPAQGWHDRATIVRAEGTAAVAEAVVERWYTNGLAQREPDRIVAARDMVAATPAEGYASCCEVIAAMDLTGDLDAVSAPTLAIAGSDDPATPPPHLRRIAAGVRNGRLLIVPDSAHLVNDEQPTIVNRSLIAHLTDGLTPGGDKKVG